VDWSKKLVTSLPLTELWTDSGPSDAMRAGRLGNADVRELLRGQPLQFVIADTGKPLVWTPEEEGFAFWKREVQPHLLWANVERYEYQDYPGQYCYAATQWVCHDGSVIILLEMYH
jgi:hypothetical protein